MSFLNWFSGKFRPARGAMPRQAGQAAMGSDILRALPSQPAASSPESGFKSRRHARREQLYEAIRCAMTQAGVLSASYKFKVLSHDRRGNSFLLLMELNQMAGDSIPEPAEMEALVVQSAGQRYGIGVSAVYWRIHQLAAPVPAAYATARYQPAPLASSDAADHEPIEPEEIVAFQRALLAASALGSALAPEAGVPPYSPLAHSAASLPEDFEDTEATQTVSFPVLSATQYGELR